jgi:hypothetical protein
MKLEVKSSKSEKQCELINCTVSVYEARPRIKPVMIIALLFAQIA